MAAVKRGLQSFLRSGSVRRCWSGGSYSTSAESLIRERMRNVVLSPTLHINQTVKKMQEEGRDVCHFGFGQSPFPVPDSVADALRQNAPEKDYLPVRGLPELQAAIASHMNSQVTGRRTEAQQVMVGPGSKQLLFQLFLLFNGDIILPSPCWVSYGPQAQIAGQSVTLANTTETDHWHIKAEEFERICKESPGRRKLLLVNTPCNPTGQTYTLAEMEELVVVCRQHDVVLVADEIYGILHHTGGHISFADVYPEGTIVTSGLSKWCGAGGWRMGYAAFPKQLEHLLVHMDCIASETYSATSAPVQHAAVVAYEGSDEIFKYVEGQRAILKAVTRVVHEELTRGGVRALRATGGFYMMVDFGHFRNQLAARNLTTSSQVCAALLEEAGVALLPGSAFMRDASELSARLSFVNFDGGLALREWAAGGGQEGELTKEFVDRTCPKTVAGAKAISAWLAAL